MNSNKTVAVAMSGGVDSSVAALLLKEQGYHVVGFTGKMQNNKAFDQVIKNAKTIADSIGIEHCAVDLSEEFQKCVIEYFEETYKIGQTPNPCTVCNSKIKWGALRDFVKNNIKADYYATGHYAEIRKEISSAVIQHPIRNRNDSEILNQVHNDKDINHHNYKIYRAKDDKKDQIYMLFNLTQEDLAQTIFPLTDLKKDQVREIAHKYNLPCASGKDSQDVCFIPKPDTTKKYLLRTFGKEKGDIVDINTKHKLGEHTGYYQYTIGQRKGLGIAAPEPLYVIKLDAERNIVYVGYKNHLEQSIVNLKNINWQQQEYKNSKFKALIKIRYNTEAKLALICPSENNTAKIELENPEMGVSPGQACVIYDINSEFLIGGGFIY